MTARAWPPGLPGVVRSGARPSSLVRDLLELTKPRITTLVVLTAGAAYLVASVGPVRGWGLLDTLLGTALVAGGTNALNQIAEAEADARMRRTRDRPIPAGRLGRAPAAVFAVALGLLGCWYLLVRVNPPTALLAAATLLIYVGAYTPLKRRTSLATLVGAVPGALPAVGGWVAARGTAEPGAWVLGAILFLWQMPHFLALAWMYRRDYARAGFRMLGRDGDGASLFATAALYAAALVPAALAPSALELAGSWYLVGALGLSLWLLRATAAARRDPTARNAGRVFRITLVYLPVLLGLMILDKTG